MIRFAVLALVIPLCACGASAGISALGGQAGQISGTAAQLFGVPAATVAIQVGAEIDQISMLALKMQMLRAQLDGQPITPPPLPAQVPHPFSMQDMIHE